MPVPSVTSALAPRRRSRPHRIPVEPDLEREGKWAESGVFLGEFAKAPPRQGTDGGSRPDYSWITVRSRAVDEDSGKTDGVASLRLLIATVPLHERKRREYAKYHCTNMTAALCRAARQLSLAGATAHLKKP